MHAHRKKARPWRLCIAFLSPPPLKELLEIDFARAVRIHPGHEMIELARGWLPTQRIQQFVNLRATQLARSVYVKLLKKMPKLGVIRGRCPPSQPDISVIKSANHWRAGTRCTKGS